MTRRKLAIVLICSIVGSIYCTEEAIKKQPDIGVLVVKDGPNSSLLYLAPLMEFFLDDSIKAIVILLEVDYGDYGSSPAFSLARSIIALKKTYKKPVVVYGEDWLSGSTYIIAVAADYIMASPLCICGHLGYHTNYIDISAQHSKNGIQETPIKSGKYKYFADQNHPITKEDLKKIQTNFNNCWQNIVKELIELRPVLDKHKDKWINGEVFVANQSNNIDNFFVDKIGDKIDLDNFVAQLINQKDKNKILVKEAVSDLAKTEINKDKENKIIILDSKDLLKWEDSNYYFDVITKAFDDEKALGIILNINLYGVNSGATMYNLYTQVKKLKRSYNKPVVAYIDDIAFSGGYWLACCAD